MMVRNCILTEACPVTRRIGTDWQLQARMFLTMFLLAALYLLFAEVLYRAGAGMGLIVILVGGMAFAQYYFSDQLVLLSTGAREVSEAEAPELHEMVGRLAAMADLPKPRVAVVETAVPNAFATGRSPSHAVVAVTTGLLQRLNRDEVEAVLAHEITHIHNRDMVVMTLASFFASIASYIVQMSFWWGPVGGYGYRSDERDRESPAFVLLVSMLVWVISFFLINALSRYREYAADRGSALLTGAPSHLASALVRISGAMERVPQRDLRQAEALNAFFIVPALSSESFLELFATHPSLEHRLAHLRRIEEELARRR
jgi:heat shock protein HtpX